MVIRVQGLEVSAAIRPTTRGELSRHGMSSDGGYRPSPTAANRNTRAGTRRELPLGSLLQLPDAFGGGPGPSLCLRPRPTRFRSCLGRARFLQAQRSLFGVPLRSRLISVAGRSYNARELAGIIVTATARSETRHTMTHSGPPSTSDRLMDRRHRKSWAIRAP